MLLRMLQFQLFLYLLIIDSPGGIYTPFQVATREASEMENWGSHYGLGRPGQASEVATSFVFLASADSSFYCMCSLVLDAHLLTMVCSRRTGSSLLSVGRLKFIPSTD